MDIIIVGCGKIGSTLAQQLCREGHNISVIDIERSLVEDETNRNDVFGVVGNGASYEKQSEAGLETAELLIAVTGNDELNLLCCLIAKKMGNCQTIARIKNPEYMEEIRMLRDEFGLAMIINSELAAAREVARLIRFPSAVKIETFAKGRVEILKYKLHSGSRLHNHSLMEISDKLKCDVLVCAVEREGEVIIPNGTFVLKEGDMVSLVATPKNAAEFFKKIGIVTNKVRDALLVGGGGITYYVSKELLNMGIDVTIIEKNRERCKFLSEELPRAMVIHGDGIDRDILMEEGLQTVDSFCALTNIDEENIMLSLFAKKITDAKLVTKVHKISFDDIIDDLDLGSIICPKNIVAENILQYVRAMENSVGSNVETLYHLIDDRAEALEFIVRKDCPLIGVPLEALRLRKNVIIACINHFGKFSIPKGQDMIVEGDRVIIITTESGLNDISDVIE